MKTWVIEADIGDAAHPVTITVKANTERKACTIAETKLKQRYYIVRIISANEVIPAQSITQG